MSQLALLAELYGVYQFLDVEKGKYDFKAIQRKFWSCPYTSDHLQHCKLKQSLCLHNNIIHTNIPNFSHQFACHRG